jgi:heterogeneous nuclear rnp K-like protein 2
MSASPTAAPTQSTKRPLEDPSSPSAPSDQPEAKRPALDKIVKGEDEEHQSTSDNLELPAVGSNGDLKAETTNGTKSEVKDEQGDTVVLMLQPAVMGPSQLKALLPQVGTSM